MISRRKPIGTADSPVRSWMIATGTPVVPQSRAPPLTASSPSATLRSQK